ncbi:MAG: hypothetical protein KGL35_00390, partial [Bradyrhizobium sp.]|nr:hypothetical protein [Bradyrhizobium sp.]
MSTTPNLGLTYLTSGQLQPEATVNNDLNIIDAAFGGAALAFSNQASTTTALTYGYYGGNVYSNGANIIIAAGTVALTASATNYVQRTAAGIVSVNTTGFTSGLIPMATVVTGASTITSITDNRPAWSDLRGRQVIAVASTNITLTDAQVNARILSFQGTLTANVVVTFPTYQQEWVLSNETTGSFTLQVQTAGGSPITLPQGAASIVYGNGTVLRAASSAGGGGASGSTTVTIGTGVTLTPTQAAAAIIRVQGAMTANAELQFPAAIIQVWEISNETSGAFTLTAIVNGSVATPIMITQGDSQGVWSDGTNLHVITAGGPAGGDLTGNYPNPALAPSGVTAGTYANPQLTLDAKGRAISVTPIGGAVATLPASPLVSGTVYQNTGTLPLLIMQPVTFNPTSIAAATCAVALGSTSTPPTIDTESAPAGLLVGSVWGITLAVPPGWYYSFTTTNAVLGTATGFTGSTSYNGITPSDFAENPATTTGLTWGYLAGTAGSNGTPTTVAAGTVALTASATNYVELSPTGSVTANTTGWTVGNIPLRLLVTSASAITSDTDVRAFLAVNGVTLANTSAWTKNQYVAPTALTYASTVTPDASTSNNFELTLTGACTLANPTNLVNGMVLNFCVDQDATGGRVLTLGSLYKWPGGTVPTWVTTASAKNFFSAYYDG